MSYNFKQVKSFKIGERYWESGQYGSINFEVTSDPVVTTHSHGDRVEFMARDVNSGHEIRYILSEGYEHYGPQIYDMPMYDMPKLWKTNMEKKDV